jgi:hypothetical protein
LRTTVARVVASRATTLIVASPGTLTVTQARGLPISPPLAQETDALVVGTTEVLTSVGATVRAAEPLRLAMLEAPAPREALTTPPSVGKTPALAVTVARLPRPKVMQALTAASEHDVERDVIVLPLITVGTARTAGTVIAADATGKVALMPALARPPPVGTTPAPRLIVPKGPRPRLMQALTRALPVHSCWIAVSVFVPMTVLVGMTIVLVIAGVETGTLAPRLTMLPSVLRAPRVTVVEGPTPSAKQSTLLQEAVVVVITAPPGRVVGTLEAVMAGVTPAPMLMRLPSAFRAPRVTVAEGPTASPRQTTPLHALVVLVTPEMLGRPVTVGVAPAPRPRSRMLPSAGLRTPRVAVAEGPRPIAKQTSPLHLVEVDVKAPLGAEKVVGVAPALPPTPRLTVTPFPIPRVAHKSTNAPPQLVVVEVKETLVGKVIPVGIEIALVMGPRSLVMDPTSLVMDATTLDCCERMEEMEAVASL